MNSGERSRLEEDGLLLYTNKYELARLYFFHFGHMEEGF